jgi:hypothetical protein
MVGMAPNLSRLPDDTVSVYEFGGEDTGVLVLVAVFQIDAMPHQD